MNLYFSGIGGVGIGPLAEIALEAGYNVQGSDMKKSLMTEQIKKRGIDIDIVSDDSFLQACHKKKAIDWLVYTSSLDPNHPELILAKKLGIKTTKRDELLVHIIEQNNLKLIAVAGTHGKTTTTGMFIWALIKLGIAISYSVGSTLEFGPSGKFDPNSQYFIYECDEFDRNFLKFKPYLSLITSLDYDHKDSYPTEQSYLNAFRQFGQQSESIITWRDQHSELFLDHHSKLIIDDVLDLKLAGYHNRRNGTLVVEAIKKLEIRADALSAVNSFPGTNRRFEKIADNLYSDYAHHPVEIAATLQMAREISENVVVVYQPHQNIRQHEIKDQYNDCFTLAESVYWLATYLSREDPDLAVLSPEDLTANISNKDSIHIAELNDKLWQNIQLARNKGKLVVCMGAGSIDSWIRDRLY